MTKEFFKGSTMLDPLPVTLITSKYNNKVNVFTAAWIGIVCTKPPMLSVSIRPERLSYDYIKSTGEFVVNLPSKSLAKIVDFCGVRSGRDIDKIEKFNLPLGESKNVLVPYIESCPINIECKVHNIIPLGSHDMFIANIVGIHVDSSLKDSNGKIHYENARLLSYCHGEYYTLPKVSEGKFGYSVQKKKKSRTSRNTKNKRD
ncbi:flavin reductase family protein [Hathewaya massiliensis]|uniref:flavin reductase family protein n=1 Tax=Hathewaya massiliensis TaxID=1964382 RepID=UPI0011597A53|nr:flavin reductase family protein [Hathewaya massiliensis]